LPDPTASASRRKKERPFRLDEAAFLYSAMIREKILRIFFFAFFIIFFAEENFPGQSWFFPSM
jgi:hypothetical protein